MCILAKENNSINQFSAQALLLDTRFDDPRPKTLKVTDRTVHSNIYGWTDNTIS